MELSKQENISRQSSILKLPKQRQPLQCVATNSSSLENSPTVKIKRRVSFAKNRRIREFCNEAEPESVWNNTYEEHDLSSTKSNCSGNTNEHPVIISVPCDEKENFPVQLFLQNNELICKEIQTTNINTENDLIQNNVELNTSLISKNNSNVQSEKVSPSALCFNEIVNIITKISTNAVPSHNIEGNSLNDTVPVSQICSQSESVETLDNALSNKCLMMGSKNKNNSDIDKTRVFTELTPVFSTLIGIGGVKNQINQVEAADLSNNDQDKTNSSCSAQMEFTSVLPCSTWKSTNESFMAVKEKKTTNGLGIMANVVYNNVVINQNIDTAIDLSENLKRFSDKLPATTKVVDSNNVEIESIQEKINILPRKSMEITETVSICQKVQEFQDNIKSSSNQLIKIAEAVPIFNRDYHHGTGSNHLVSETMNETSTKINNISVENNFSIYETNYQSGTDINKLSHQITQDTTKMLSTRSKELMETGVTCSKDYGISVSNEKVMCDEIKENTKYFSNRSMEVSETVPIYNNFKRFTNVKIKTDNTTKEKSEIFLDKSMEITQAVSLPKQIQKSVDKITTFPGTTSHNKTTIFNDKSMEISETIPVYNKNYLNIGNVEIKKTKMEHTKIFANKSMELAEVITVQGQNDKEITGAIKTIKKFPVEVAQNKTKIFLEKSMDITEPVPIKKLMCKNDGKKIAYEAIPINAEIFTKETKYFYNKSMDITNPRSSIKGYDDIIPNTSHELTQDKTKIFSNKSMEMVETAIIHNNNQQTNIDKEKSDEEIEEKTNIFLNNSMELTEAVPIHRKIYQSSIDTNKILFKSVYRKKTDDDKPMVSINSLLAHNVDISVANTDQSHSVISDRENSEKISVLYNSKLPKISLTPEQIQKVMFTLPEKVQTHEQTSNKIAEVNFHMNNKSLSTHTSRTPIRQFDSVFKKVQCKGQLECNELNKSMNITKTACSYPIIRENNTKEYSSELNVSLINKVTPTTLNTTNDDNKTKFFYDKSVNITETVPISHDVLSTLEIKKLSKNIYLDNSKTLHKIMHSTENIQNHQPFHTFDSNEQNTLNNSSSEDENTKIFLNKSMDITDMIAPINYNVKFAISKGMPSKGYKIFHNISTNFTADNDCLQKKNENGLPTQSTTRTIYHNTSIEMRPGLPVIQSQYNNDQIYKETEQTFNTTGRNFQLSFDHLNRQHKSIDVEETELESNQRSDIIKKKSIFQESLHDSIKVFHDVSMEDTLEPTLLSNSINNLTKLNSYTNQNILSSHDGIINSINGSKNFHKENNNESLIRFNNGEESFHRITSDELNTLCASMNLPTQRNCRNDYKEENYVSLCNSNNLEGNSLKNSKHFQQQPVLNSNIFSKTDKILNNCVANIDKENNFRIFSDANIREEKSVEREKEKMNNVPTSMDYSAIQTDSVENSLLIEKNLEYPNYQQQSCSKITVYHDNSVEMNKNISSSTKLANCNISNYLPHDYQFEKIYDSFHNCNNENNNKGSSIILTNQQNNTCSNVSSFQMHNISKSAEMHENINTSNFNCKTLSSIENINFESQQNVHENPNNQFQNSKIPIYHDSVELTIAASDSLNTEKNVTVNNTSLNSNKITKNISEIMDTSEINVNYDKNKNDAITKEYNLSRVPSDNTDILLATMGFKTKLSHPLIINDKTTIKVLNKPLLNKTYNITASNNVITAIDSWETNVKNLNTCNESKEENVSKISTIKNVIETNDTYEDFNFNKEDKDISEKMYSLQGNNLEELEKIQPPSFLCSDSFEDNIVNRELLNKDHTNSLSEDLKERYSSLPISETEQNAQIIHSKKTEELKRFSNEDLNILSEHLGKKVCKQLSSKNQNNKKKSKPSIHEIKEKEKPLTPIQSLIENIKKFEKRDDCIWSIRAINYKLIALDFITKSFVVVIRLNETEEACIRDIKQVELISRLPADSNNILLKIVHNLLMLKLDPNEMEEKYKMYEHVLPLLEYISSEVIFVMNFMFDLKRIKSVHLLNIDQDRITFMVASKKANIILKISLMIKIFKEIGPNDIDVKCVLGDIRKIDINRLIINIKKDDKFLSRYINDIKDYITLMEESTYLNR